MFYWIIKGLAWPIVTIYLRFRRSGKTRVPERGPCIVVANHASYLDPAVLGSASPRKLHFLINRRVYRYLPLRWFYYMMDAVPVSTDRADLAALRRALQVLEAGGAVGVFPEGARMKDGQVGEGKIGFAFLAARSGAPVIPAAIVGAHQAMPVGSSFPRPRPVRVIFGEEMRYDGLEGRARRSDLEAFADRVMSRISELASDSPPRGAPAVVGAVEGESR
jgi:1-acyl-sn-glycerol-3-phosphate acyltransferase